MSSGILQVLGAAGAGRAAGKVKREQMDTEELKDALLMQQNMKRNRREDRALDMTVQNRKDMLQFRKEDAAERGKDRDDDRAERAREHNQRDAELGESRAARKEARDLRPDEREKAADDFAYRMVEAANGDPRVAQDYGARDLPTAKKFGLRRDHYYAASQRYKDRLTSKSKPVESDPELDGAAASPKTQPAAPGKKPLTDADRKKAASDPAFKTYLEKRGYKL